MPQPDKTNHIFVDKTKYDVTDDVVKGATLRALPDPDVPAERDLYEEVPGGEDRLINDGDDVTLRNGQHFFTVPKTINPGA